MPRNTLYYMVLRFRLGSWVQIVQNDPKFDNRVAITFELDVLL
jgi:hypothetical protein